MPDANAPLAAAGFSTGTAFHTQCTLWLLRLLRWEVRMPSMRRISDSETYGDDDDAELPTSAAIAAATAAVADGIDSQFAVQLLNSY